MVEGFPTALRFATAAYPDADRVEAWRHMFGHTICGLDIEPLPDKLFQSATTLRVLPGLGVAAGASSGARYWRSAHRIDHDDLVFVINHEGHDLARMSGREATLSPGEAVLFATDRVGGTTNTGYSRFTTLRVPRSVVAGADDAVLKPVSRDNDALQLLRSYLGVLSDARALATGEQQRQIVSHVHDLIVMAVCPPQRMGEAGELAGVAAARTRAIKRDVLLNATDPEFDIETIAAWHRVTPRYVQMLFARAGTNFSEYAHTVRLAIAHQLLRQPIHRNKRISEIALDVGFPNVSYFNRAFRRTFNATPSDVRFGVAAVDH